VTGAALTGAALTDAALMGAGAWWGAWWGAWCGAWIGAQAPVRRERIGFGVAAFGQSGRVPSFSQLP
jgi:hypothetical protein